MTVNEMEEVDRNGDDKYSAADVTISVNCKPKAFIPQIQQTGPIIYMQID